MPILIGISIAVTTLALALGLRLGAFRAVTNYQGRPVSVAGLALVLGAVAGLASHGIPALAGIVAAGGFGFFGAVDDRWGDRSASGFAGHLRAAARGRITTGFLKVLGGGTTALVAAWLLHPPAGDSGTFFWLARAMVIALGANALNLLDTRPVRALTAYLVLAATTVTLGGAPLPAAIGAGSAIAFLPWDRARRAMLGDAGSNTLGALWALSAVAAAPWPSILALSLALIAFHIWTEGHSINAAISAHPRLAALDRLLRAD